MRARDIMTSPVVTVAEDDTLHNAARILLDNNISAAPVLDAGGSLVGIVSEADLIERLALPDSQVPSSQGAWLRNNLEAAAVFVRTHARLIRDVMTRAVITADEEAPVDELATLILDKGIKRLPILRGQHVMGIVSRVDLLRMLYTVRPMEIASCAAQASLSIERDHDLQNLVSRALADLPWYRPWPVEVIVVHGVVHLWGRVPNDIVRQAYVMVVGDIAGDTEILDHTHVIPALMHQIGGSASYKDSVQGMRVAGSAALA